ncbi:MAG TPA: pectate lyase [Bacteroides sp.]|nr:pectate lyase [Bacteroides sp.]
MVFILIGFTQCAQEVEQKEVVAFPGAEGYGRHTPGGRGGDVYIVTNLKDSGEGSLRYGIENADGPRTIVFEVSGTILLKDHLIISKPFLTIAGQTAPGDGIAIRDYGLKIKDTHDVIMRYVRIRLGDQNKPSPAGFDAIETNDVSNIIFDHISASWGIDGTHDLRGEKFTLQWSIYGEALHNSLHEKGPHAMLGSMRDLTDNITLHHNLMHSSRHRHPSLGGGSKTDGNSIVDFRNNVLFNWSGPTNLGECNMNLINNYYKPGEDTNPEEKPMAVKAHIGEKSKGFSSGNVFSWNEEWTADNFSAIEYVLGWGSYDSTTREAFVLPAEVVDGDDKPQTHSAEEAFDLVLKQAGASLHRDAADARVVAGVIAGTGRLIDSQEEVGGWPELKSLPAPTDKDRDGMPDAWEKANKLDPSNPEDRNGDKDKDGYTNLEEYLASIVE